MEGAAALFGGGSHGEEEGRSSGGRSSLADRRAAIASMKTSDLAAVVAQSAKDMHAAGRLSEDVVMRYLRRIEALFPKVSSAELDVAMTVWGIYNSVGSRTDYAQAPDIVVGGTSVKATRIFGGVIPVTAEGLPRKFFKTAYGDGALDIAKANPKLVAFLNARLAQVGMEGADISAAIDFIDGTTPGTTGGGSVRAAVKDLKVARRVGETVQARTARHHAGVADVPVQDVSAERLY